MSMTRSALVRRKPPRSSRRTASSRWPRRAPISRSIFRLANPNRRALCHPGRPYYAKDKCASCYAVAAKKKRDMTGVKGTRSGHPEGVVHVRAPGWGSLLGWGYR
jgi:hypothetical protein